MRFRDNREELRTGKPIAAWVSRHEPTPEQRESLAAYAIVQIGHDDKPVRSAALIWREIQEECKGKPALIMAVMPVHMLVSLFKLVRPIPVIRAQMVVKTPNAEMEWMGTWSVVTGIKLMECTWTPDGGGAVMKVLNEREKEVIGMVAKGMCNKEIAAALNISLRTVKRHVSAVLKKTNSNNRVHAIAKLWSQLNAEVS